jgi:hypothetical protein
MFFGLVAYPEALIWCQDLTRVHDIGVIPSVGSEVDNPDFSETWHCKLLIAEGVLSQ